MSERCETCGHSFANDLELDAHEAQVHAVKWFGPHTFSESGDEGATGAIGPDTADTLSPRPDAWERAKSLQR